MSTNPPYQTGALYVGDLHEDVTESILHKIFSDAGNILSIRVCRNAMTKKSLGYAYVNFQRVEDAERALEALNYTEIHGKPVRIMWCQRDPSVRKSGIGNIFIKNLDKTIDNKALYDTFSAFGNILSCKVCTRPEKNAKNDKVEGEEETVSKGYGFVHFETQEAAEEAIAKVNGMLLNGKKVYVGPFLKRHERLKLMNSDNKFTNIFVKNLDKSVTQEELEKLFEEYGKIQHAAIARSENGESRGFAFVNFEKHESAKEAVEKLNGKDLNGKTLFCARHQKRAERKALLKEKFEKLRQEKMNKYQGVNLYVKHIDDSIDDEALKNEFGKFGTITSSIIMKNDNGQSRGFGFVCFSNPEEANKAMTEMNGKILCGKPLYVVMAQKKEQRRAHLEAQHAHRMRFPMAPPMGYPVFYPPQPGVMPARGGMPPVRPRWQGPQRGPQMYLAPTPVYGQPPRTRGRGRGNARGANANSANNRQQFRYNQNARNTNKQTEQVPQQPLQEQPTQQPQQGENGEVEDLQSALADLPVEQQKHLLGEKLFPLVLENQRDEELAAKITGMLIEMDTSDLLHLVESPTALNTKITEAVDVLKNHSA